MLVKTEPKFKKYAWEPRSFLVQPTHFGLYDDAQWREVTGGGEEQDRLLAAQWQHEIVLLVHDALAYKGKTATWLAAQTRMGADNLWRLMRGVGAHEGRGLRRAITRAERLLRPPHRERPTTRQSTPRPEGSRASTGPVDETRRSGRGGWAASRRYRESRREPSVRPNTI